ncbi:MAG TPA: hypothetical protein VGF45_08335 [Polyangia bacterium]
MKRILTVLFAASLVAGVACKKNEPPPAPPPAAQPAPPPPPPPPAAPAPVAVQTVTLGKEIGADKKVAAPVEVFGVKDTIYASVETSGVGPAKVRALWSFVKGAKTVKVDESTLEFDATAPATNEFHISKPSGWPKGDYKVEIFLGDAPAPAATKTFKVG